MENQVNSIQVINVINLLHKKRGKQNSINKAKLKKMGFRLFWILIAGFYVHSIIRALI